MRPQPQIGYLARMIESTPLSPGLPGTDLGVHQIKVIMVGITIKNLALKFVSDGLFTIWKTARARVLLYDSVISSGRINPPTRRFKRF